MWVANKVSAALKIDFSQDMKGITSCSANMCLDTEGADKLTARYPVKETAQFMSFDGTLTLMEVAVSSLTKTITDRSHPQCTQVSAEDSGLSEHRASFFLTLLFCRF